MRKSGFTFATKSGHGTPSLLSRMVGRLLTMVRPDRQRGKSVAIQQQAGVGEERAKSVM